MNLLFDISDDELPIFQAEVNDQIETLEQGFLRLEQDHDDPVLLQEVFRAAHTIKGSAGMIGHDRMTRLTHAMESVLDGLRKGEIGFSTDMVDICLSAVDILRLLHDEVGDSVQRVEDIEPLVEQINIFSISTVDSFPADSSAEPQDAGGYGDNAVMPGSGSIEGEWHLEIAISSNSIASAARAFQIVLALQSLGTITHMDPDQQSIESAVPVHDFKLDLSSDYSMEEIRDAVLDVSEVDAVTINGNCFGRKDMVDTVPVSAQTPQSMSDKDPGNDERFKLGGLLVQEGLISEKQLQQALQFQRTLPPPSPMLGQILVKLQFITQEVLDKAVARQVTSLRKSLKSAQTDSAEIARTKVVDQMVRTSVDRLDSLMNLVGELITSRNRLYRVRNEFESLVHSGVEIDTLSQTVAQIGRITDQLQEEIMEIRMLPVSNVFNKYPRLVRDLARRAQKKVELEIYGEETELDRSVIDKIRDPLVHLLRNAVDHGIEMPAKRTMSGKPEEGTVRLSAEHDSGQIIITISDDGGGIDTGKLKRKALDRGLITEAEAAALKDEDALDLIFKPGLSTADMISDISGRGVGMDIVRNNVESTGGMILVDSVPGKGTRFQVMLPLTLAIVPTLLVGMRSLTYAIPLAVITETLHIAVDSVQTIKEQPVIILRNQVLPVLKLSDVLGFPKEESSEDHTFVVAIQSGKNRVGLIVDSLLGEEELMVKSIDELVGRSRGVSGAAILGDGQVALIIDVPGLLQLAGKTRFRRAEEVETHTLTEGDLNDN